MTRVSETPAHPSLAPFFGELAERPLFIVYELRPKAGKPGTDKVPVGPYTEPHPWQAIDCHDPAARMTLAEAEFWVPQLVARPPALGYGVGYVLTDDAHTWFLDLDHCRTGGVWADYVAPTLALFPGAFVECSSSGDGIHVLGRYTGPRPLHRTRCRELGAEFYTGGRFCALTGAAATGAILSDHTAALAPFMAARFPPREDEGDGDEWTTGPVSAWRGPIDDAALVERACRSTTARAAFGDAASFADLWRGDVDKLARAYPPQTAGQSHDASAADQALCNHLAYWTGNDCDRIARLLRASGLARGKHEREEYVRSTVLRACASQTTWYAERVAPGTNAATTTVGVPPALHVADIVPGGDSPPPPPATTGTVAHTVTFDRQGRVESTLANVTHLLRERTQGVIRLDSFTGIITIGGELLSDTLVSRIRIALESMRVAPPGDETVRAAIEVVAEENQYDSAQDWLNSLRWDGVPRVETFMATYCRADDNAYTRSVACYQWTAHAGRILAPGCQADMVPIWVGPQGIRKSSAVAAIAPHPDYFTDVRLNEKEADLARRMRGKVIGEIAELQGLRSRDAETIKAIITTRRDQWVPKFKEYTTTAARRLVFVGTTNQERFLDDDTGERRWLPVRVGIVDVDAIARDREQLWAEAAALWRLGGIQWAEAERLGRAEHADYKVSDPWEDAIDRWASEPGRMSFTIEDVLAGALLIVKGHMGRTEQGRAAKILRRLGWSTVQVSVAGARRWRWVRTAGP